MKLGDKAAETPEVSLASQLTGSVYELIDDELVAADELTPEGEFPQYGDFLEVQEESPVDGTERGKVHIEVPTNLAQLLVEEIAPTTSGKFRVVSHQKVDGEHRYEVQHVEE